jgi:hypothetical protein
VSEKLCKLIDAALNQRYDGGVELVWHALKQMWPLLGPDCALPVDHRLLVDELNAIDDQILVLCGRVPRCLRTAPEFRQPLPAWLLRAPGRQSMQIDTK